MEKRGVVDRVVDGRAVIALPGGAEIIIPARMLPPGAGEGSVLILALEIRPDKDAEEARKKKVLGLQDKLRNR